MSLQQQRTTENQIKKKKKATIAGEKMKYLGINLKQYVQDLSAENIKL